MVKGLEKQPTNFTNTRKNLTFCATQFAAQQVFAGSLNVFISTA